MIREKLKQIVGQCVSGTPSSVIGIDCKLTISCKDCMDKRAEKILQLFRSSAPVEKELVEREEYWEWGDYDDCYLHGRSVEEPVAWNAYRAELMRILE